MSFNLKCTVNGIKYERKIKEDLSLLKFLREELNLKGTKEGCGEGECGACTVILNGKNVNSCITPAIQADSAEIVTIEGIENDKELSEIQKCFLENGAVQCGFCTPGMIMSAKVLLDSDEPLNEEKIRRAMSGNLCRCTGYQAIVNAIKQASLLKKHNKGNKQ